MEMKKKDIRALTKDQLRAFFEEIGEKPFRGNQVYEWLWSKGAHSFEDMTNISKSTRQILENNFVINHIHVDQMQRSKDGTIKNAVRLHDGLVVESVLIPTPTRTTACVSSQVGCSLDCKFCATARLKRMRNLNPDEIYDQVVAIDRESYNNVIKAIDKITSPEGLGMSPKRITLSTSGVPKMIKKMADDSVKFKLAVSLHSAIDHVRTLIMPFNETFPDIDALINFCSYVPCKVNLIEYNPIDDGMFQQASSGAIDQYIKELESKGIVVNVRRSRGKDIDAACGQLANKS